MSRIDEMIYYLDQQVKIYENMPVMFNQQEIMGKDRLCCAICGHCPETEAEMLREIRDELRAKTSSSVSKPKKDTTRESEDNAWK